MAWKPQRLRWNDNTAGLVLATVLFGFVFWVAYTSMVQRGESRGHAFVFTLAVFVASFAIAAVLRYGCRVLRLLRKKLSQNHKDDTP